MKAMIHLAAIKSTWKKLDELKETNQLSLNFAKVPLLIIINLVHGFLGICKINNINPYD